MAAAADDAGTDADCDKNDDNTCKIIIIGAGIAGISAAAFLASKGEKNFKILEARNRKGGRIVSIPMGGIHVELGARWIHGVLENPVYELALKHGLVNVYTEQDVHNVVATTEDGKRVPINTVEEVYSSYFWFCKRCEEYFLLKTDPPSVVGNSVGRHLEADISTYLEQFSESERNIRRMIFDHLLNRETCITGCHSMDETSLSDFGSYTELPGGNVTISSGYSSVIDSLVQEIPENSILVNHVVKNISWKKEQSEECANNHCETDRRRVSVVCENGSRFFCQHVLVTVPLGVLKANAKTLFTPSLPDYKLECIQRLSFCTVNKIYLEYDRPFLNPDITEIITLWNRQNDHSSSISENWHRKIYSFSKVGECVMVAWLSGNEAEYVEGLSSDEVGDTCTNVLRKLLNDPYVPKPCRVVCTSWNTNPYTCGSYTSIGIHSSQRDIELLGSPIYSHPYHNKPVLGFAGEATHPNFYSTVHGAYISGHKAAELFLDSSDSGADNVHATCETSETNVAELSSWLKGIDLD